MVIRIQKREGEDGAVDHSPYTQLTLEEFDHFPQSTEFRADDYDFLAAHPAPFRNFTEPFLCLIGMSRNYTLDEDTYLTFLHDDGTVEMDCLAFIHVADPIKVKVGERERAKEEARLLDSTVGRVVPLLPVAPARAESELEESVDKLFDESGGVDQGDSAGGGGQKTADEAATDASGSSHPPKKLRNDHGTSGGAASAGKSPTVLKQLLASSILNVESGVGAAILFLLPPLPFLPLLSMRVVSVVVPPVMTEAVITTHVASIPSAMAPEPGTKVITPVHASMFHDSESTGTVRPDAAGSSRPPRK
ncbi:hypothetical protein Tco_0184101 [Tanacetum coccineum]